MIEVSVVLIMEQPCYGISSDDSDGKNANDAVKVNDSIAMVQ